MSADEIEHDCPRCGRPVHQRYYGPCGTCRTDLAERYAGRARAVEVADYEPKDNVTANSVAMREE
jgi:hypothetical protein